jgi:hypothetical protein
MTTIAPTQNEIQTTSGSETFVWYVRANDANNYNTTDDLQDRVTLNTETLKDHPERAITLERAKADGTYEPAITLSAKAVTVGNATVYALGGALFDLNENGHPDAAVKSSTGYAHKDLGINGNAMISTGNGSDGFAFSSFPDGIQNDTSLGYKNGYLKPNAEYNEYITSHTNNGILDFNKDGLKDEIKDHLVFKGYFSERMLVYVPDYYARQMFISAQKPE